MTLKISLLAGLFVVAFSTGGCATPKQTQEFFQKSVIDDPMLEPIHTTALYTVYYDHALRRCVLHAAYTWGESGGGTGGTGLGVTVFKCDPRRLRAHVLKLEQQKSMGITKFPFPPSRPKKTVPPKKRTAAPVTPAPRSSLPGPSSAADIPSQEPPQTPVPKPALVAPRPRQSVTSPPVDPDVTPIPKPVPLEEML